MNRPFDATKARLLSFRPRHPDQGHVALPVPQGQVMPVQPLASPFTATWGFWRLAWGNLGYLPDDSLEGCIVGIDASFLRCFNEAPGLFFLRDRVFAFGSFHALRCVKKFHSESLGELLDECKCLRYVRVVPLMGARRLRCSQSLPVGAPVRH